MTVRTLAFSVIGFVAGVAVVLGFRSQPAPEPVAAPAATVASTTDAAQPSAETIEYHSAPHETIIGGVAIVPLGAVADDDSYDFTFDAVSLAPQAQSTALAAAFGEELDPVHAASIYPMEWVLETGDGDIDGSIPGPGVNVVRFPVEEGFSEESVEALTISRYLFGAPIDASFTLSLEQPHLELFPGGAVNLIQVSHHAESSIVRVGASAVASTADWMFIIGEGHGWRSFARDAGGGSDWTLTWVGNDLPTDIPLRIVGTAWLEGDGSVEIDIEGIR
jgi:hypothetical protein